MDWRAAIPAGSGRWHRKPASAAAMYRITLIVNDKILGIRLKTCQIKLFEADFDIELFVLAELNALNQAN